MNLSKLQSKHLANKKYQKSEGGRKRHNEANRRYKLTEKGQKANRGHNLEWKYGLSLEGYDKMFARQNGCCAICGRHQFEFNRHLDIDHNHKTGKIRGLLCNTCNMALGALFADTLGILNLQKAIEYLIQNG